jgi:hypothetical protein
MHMVNHQIKVLQALYLQLLKVVEVLQVQHFQSACKSFKLYEFEGSPFCRRVREVITLLNLDVEIYPCPERWNKISSIVKEKGGKLQFPF